MRPIMQHVHGRPHPLYTAATEGRGTYCIDSFEVAEG